MLSVNRSTASIWARKSVSSSLATANGLVTSLSNDESWKAHFTSGFGTPPIAR